MDMNICDIIIYAERGGVLVQLPLLVVFFAMLLRSYQRHIVVRVLLIDDVRQLTYHELTIITILTISPMIIL